MQEAQMAGGLYIYRNDPRPFPTLAELAAGKVAQMALESADVLPDVCEDLVKSAGECDADDCSRWCVRPHYVATRTWLRGWEHFSVCSLSCVAKVGSPEVENVAK